ncbi:MAG: DnaD domain protein [Oscillospiraceae bacterium]|nr:DnaD domain protein [Oscillospiraceae bacterium]
MYRLKQNIINNSLPSSITSSFINADGAALKVAIYFLIYKKASYEQLSSSLAISESAIKRSIQFWEENGLLVSEEEVLEEKTSSNRLNHYEMSKAVLINPEISIILQESQQILGRELPLSESRILIEIYQTLLPSIYGILNLESFWSTRVPSKKVITETLYSARNWSSLGITEEADCEQQIKLMEKHDAYVNEVAKLMFVSPEDFTRRQKKTISSWLDEYSYDISFVSEVLLRKPDATIPYINTVLKNWYKKGYKTVSDTRETPSNITDYKKNDDLSPLFEKLLKKKQGI